MLRSVATRQLTWILAGALVLTGCSVGYSAEETSAIQEIALSVGGSLSMNAGEEVQIQTTVTTSSGRLYTLEYQSSSPTVATVGSSGVVRAVAEGSSTITVTARLVDDGASTTASVQVNVARAAERINWVFCANEYERCNFSGTRQVKYGVDVRTVTKTFTDGVDCGNAAFGDPAPGANKACYYADATVSAPDGGGPLSDAPATTATFAPDTTTDFPNPERGWYVYAAYGTGLLSASATWKYEVDSVLAGPFGEPNKIPFAYTGLAAYAGSDAIPKSALDQMRTNLAYLRQAGAKTIIRFHYGSSVSESTISTARMIAHTSQLAPVLAEYRDVIFLVQDGFLGSYGEWWLNENGRSTSAPDAKASKRAIHEAVLAMTPPEIPVNLTQVYVQQDLYPNGIINPFDGSAASRTGMHNDCIMASATDRWQFPGPSTVNDYVFTTSAANQRAYIAAKSEFVPYGGETCTGDAMRLACSGGTDNAGLSGGIMNEGPRYHISYLNRGYYTGFMSQWQSDGCYAEVSRKLGYRFQLDSISHPNGANRGEVARITVGMRNVGWARIYSARKLVATLRNRATGAEITGMGGEVRRLPSQATASSPVTVDVSVPSSAAPGTYDLFLSIPDVYETTRDNPAFSVRFANANAGARSWDPVKARWATGTSITVK